MGLNGIWRAQTWSLQPRDTKARAEGWDGAMGVGEQFARECLKEPVVACLGKGKKNKRGMKQKKEKESKAAVEGAGARLCEGCVWQHLQQHGERSLPAGQGWKSKPKEAVDGARSQQQGRISAERQHRAGDSPAAKGRGGGCAGSWALSLASSGALGSDIPVPSGFPEVMAT